MDAREYLNRKGVGLEREPERPNTLEEKAWERARGSGNQRPKAGTPHDWEDWERFHDDLTEGVETLEQKINKEAHRKALARAQEKAEASEAKAPNTQVTNTPAHAPDPVGHYTPPAVAQPASLSASQASPGQPRAGTSCLAPGLSRAGHIAAAFGGGADRWRRAAGGHGDAPDPAGLVTWGDLRLALAWQTSR